MRILRKIFFTLFLTLIILSLCLGVFYYKNYAVKKIILKSLAQKFSTAEINIGHLVYELPDELSIRTMQWKSPDKFLFLDFGQMKFEFSLSNLFKYIKTNKAADILEEFNLKLKKVMYKNITLTSTDINGNLSMSDIVYSGDIFTETLKYKKINFSDIMTKFDYSGNVLNLNIKNATFAGGRIKGAITIDFSKSPVSYQGDIFLKNLGSAELMVIFGMDKKMDMSGKWNGETHFSGTLDKIDTITGLLTADDRGGELNIKDKDMIEKIMSGVQSAGAEISESLSHHDYKEGNMSIGLDNNSIKINLSLSGKKGNRKFDIYLHDFLFD